MNVVANSLSRNVPVGSVAVTPPEVENFTLMDLAAAQRRHDVWVKIIYALESGDETGFPPLPVPFSHFFSVAGRGIMLVITSRQPPGLWVSFGLCRSLVTVRCVSRGER